MGKYKVEVGSFVTRMVTRHITVSAKSEEEAEQKAIDKFCELEMNMLSSVDVGSPQIDSIDELN